MHDHRPSVESKGTNIRLKARLMLSYREIKRVSSKKSLVLMVYINLNWDDQFKVVKSTICERLASLKRFRNILPQSKLGSV